MKMCCSFKTNEMLGLFSAPVGMGTAKYNDLFAIGAGVPASKTLVDQT